MMDRDTVYHQHPEVATRSVDDEVVLLSPATQRCHVLDPVGRRIWELLAQPRTAPQLCDRLRQDFDGPAAQIEADVVRFLHQLVDQGVVTAQSR